MAASPVSCPAWKGCATILVDKHVQGVVEWLSELRQRRAPQVAESHRVIRAVFVFSQDLKREPRTVTNKPKTNGTQELPWWYRQEPQKFMSSPDVEMMTCEEIGSYFLLLQKAWLLGENCTLPNDPVRLARLSRIDKVSDLVLSKFLMDKDGRLYNPRLSMEWQEALKRSKDAAKSANARWNKDMRPHSDRNATALPAQCDGNAKTEHNTTEQNTKTKTMQRHVSEPESADAVSSSASSETQTAGPTESAVRVAASLAAILGRDDLKPATKTAWAEQAEVLVTKHGEATVLQVMNALLADNRDGFWRGRVFAMKNFVRCFTTMHKQFVRDAGKSRAAANPLAEHTASLKTGYDFSAIAKGDL